jgi:hypothetical protein
MIAEIVVSRFAFHRAALRPMRSALAVIPAFALCAFTALALCAPGAWADEVAVPNLESRIKDSGSSVPPQALPPIANPAPVAIPDIVTKTPPAPAPVPAPAQAAPAPESTPPKASGDESRDDGLHGSASLGAGSPALLQGAIAITHAAGRYPGFSFGFRHDAADGYGRKDSGDGFFDRGTSADARVFGSGSTGEESLAVSVSDQSDGFQGRNADYYAMTHRALSWDSSIDRAIRASSDGTVTLRAGFAGSIHDAFAERPGSAAAPTAEIADYAGFGLAPRASLEFARGPFTAAMSAAASYDTVADQDPGEVKSAEAALSLGFASGPVSAKARVGALVESGADPLVPFDLSAHYEAATGLVRLVEVSGGLSADRQDPRELANTEPFALLSGVPFHSADWNVGGQATLAVTDPVVLVLGASYRTTAFDRGILILADEADAATALIPLELVSRDSLSTKARLEWRAPGMIATGGVSDEWLDRLNRKTLHTLDGSVTLFDRAGDAQPGVARPGNARAGIARARWEATARASLPLDSGEYPFLGASGTVRPAQAFAITLSVDDALPLATGHLRERVGDYAERSGTVTLSGSVDF